MKTLADLETLTRAMLIEHKAGLALLTAIDVKRKEISNGR